MTKNIKEVKLQEKFQAKWSALHQVLEDTKYSTTRLFSLEPLLKIKIVIEMKVQLKIKLNEIISHQNL